MLRQVGAIPFVIRETEPLLLMITSRTHERWIFPKGAIEKGETASEAALREAYEEAGIRGRMLEQFAHDVQAIKQMPDGPRDLIVTYIPLHFTEQHDEWPERKNRDRHWVTLPDARKIAGGPDIHSALQGFEKLLPDLHSIAKIR
ncbi:MAG: NUDIX hydrolase [Parvibaculaceae bacterium]|jgi:8-oxo-dGTP pyrophosphatase MutT (NUDIX family)|nr:NUDIX hydrolase [Parvibaculaceae bacterium]HBM88509.1 NUDIX domain-containing protein [Rhodobiaceae bacterium]